MQAWIAVASLLLLRLFVSQILLHRLRRSSREAPLRWQESLSKTCPVSLRILRRVRVPMTRGLIRPVIMIPEAYENYPEAERSFPLQHECQRLAQNDQRWLALAQVALCLHWVNPLAWLAMRRLRLAQEKSCDEAVLNAKNPPFPMRNSYCRRPNTRTYLCFVRWLLLWFLLARTP
jgi:beta-lactamase regulating signal transducer with metallopeptidase domain